MENKGSEMRRAWFDYVKKIRVKMARAEKKAVSHREAMIRASLSWADEKAKIVRKRKREARKKAKAYS